MSDMIFETLRGMLIGVSGVFAVLGIFYVTLKLLMSKAGSGEE